MNGHVKRNHSLKTKNDFFSKILSLFLPLKLMLEFFYDFLYIKWSIMA